nr:silk gland uncharacterized 5 [Tineola bisselliella]
MFQLLFVLVLIGVLQYLNAAVTIRQYVEKPEEFAKEEGCYIPELNKVLPYGESESPIASDSCSKYHCHNDNTTTIEICGSVGYDKQKCTLVADYTQAYPCCCGTLTCDGKSINVGGKDCRT